jgi:outer membrane protein insertion porin family
MKPPVRTIRPYRAAAVAAALAVCPLLASAAAGQVEAAGGPPLVTAIEVAGQSRIPESTILGVLTFRAGDRVTTVDLQRAVGRLWATGQFDDITVYVVADTTAEADPDAGVTLRIEVAERPLLAAVEFHGLENVKASTVRDTSGLRVNRPLNAADLTEAEAMIRSLLAEKGFFARKISYEVSDVPDRPGEKRVVFEVEEGLRVALADVVFEGNEAFTDAELAGALDTREEGFLWYRSGMFDEEKFRTDLREKLPAYYASRGYLDFTVARDSLAVDPLTGKARLVVSIDEGPQYRLATFDILGNRHFSTEFLRRYFEEGRGGLLRTIGIGGGGDRQVEGESVFDLVAFESATAEIHQLYQNEGYLYAQIQPVVERVPADSLGPSVRVAWQILEGNPAFIDEVRIVGNTFTHENVIRGQLNVLPGDVYSQERVIQSYQRISALGFFETPVATPQIVPDPETGDVDITFEVKEKQTGSVNFGTSLGGYSGIAGFLGYDQPNLFGQAKSGHLRWEYGRFSNNFEASYTDPAIAGSFYSGSFSLFSSSDRFYTFAEGRRRRTGTALRFGFPLWSDVRTRLSVGYSISRTTYEEFDSESASSLFSLPPGVQSTVILGLERSTTDHPLFPTVGTRGEVSAELNGGLLGGDGDFQKYTLKGEWYVPVGQLGGTAPGTRPIRLTLGLTSEAGAIFGDASRFPFDRFWMGGVQFGRPLRGYDETTITPLGYSDKGSGLALTERFGDAYLLLSATYAVRFNDNISMGLFYDAGNVWQRPSEINPTKLARGAGIGVTLVTPFGPLGLDYAYGFDKRPPGWQLHFKFGQGF